MPHLTHLSALINLSWRCVGCTIWLTFDVFVETGFQRVVTNPLSMQIVGSVMFQVRIKYS